MLTVVTLTGGRPEGFALTQRWMARQTYKDRVRWIIVDDCLPRTEISRPPDNWTVEVLSPSPAWAPGQNTQQRNMLAALAVIRDDERVVIVEDDDWYGPDYLSVVSQQLETCDLVGQSLSRKWSLGNRRGRELLDTRQASLCCTAMKGRALKEFRRVAAEGHRLMDMVLWRRSQPSQFFGGSHVVSIKCVPGRQGIDSGHSDDFGNFDDPDGVRLKQWIGEKDAEAYLRLKPAPMRASQRGRAMRIKHMRGKAFDTPHRRAAKAADAPEFSPPAPQETTREAEIEQYVQAYQSPDYKMGVKRKLHVADVLAELGSGSLLDVGTGRGETLVMAEATGLFPVRGTEVVPDLIGGNVVYAQAHELPFEDGEFDHVTCFDVLEHLVEDDLRPALAEMKRVARRTVTVSASELPSVYGGRDLHISRRPAADWLALIREVWGPEAEQIGVAGNSPMFRLTLPVQEA